MSPEQVTRTLTVFDAFLAHARSASPPPNAAHPSLSDVSTAVTAVRGGGAAPDEEEVTTDGDVTRITANPLLTEAAPPSVGSDWEEPTHERPDVMRALARSDAAQPDTDQNIALPKAPKADPRVEQASIIIEDDSLTEPEFRREDVLRAMAEHARPRSEDTVATPAPARAPVVVASPPPPPPVVAAPVISAPPPAPVMAVEDFAAEMMVLVKYGHAAQAAGEINRRVKARPEDASALGAVAQSVSRAAGRAARRE